MDKFAILRMEKKKSQLEITRAVAHNHRLIPSKADIQQGPVQVLFGDQHAAKHAKKILAQHKIRKNAVYALEFVLGASPEYFRDDPDEAGAYDWAAYEALEAKAVSWILKNFDESIIVSGAGHLSETTPHFHFLIIPVDPKGKLNAQHWIGTPQKMRDLQTSWANEVKDLGLVRGKPNKETKHVPLSVYRQFQFLGIKAFRQLMAILSFSRPKKKEDSDDKPKPLLPKDDERPFFKF